MKQAYLSSGYDLARYIGARYKARLNGHGVRAGKDREVPVVERDGQYANEILAWAGRRDRLAMLLERGRTFADFANAPNALLLGHGKRAVRSRMRKAAKD